MTNEQVQVCDDLWREALAAGLVRWMPGMVTASGKIIAQGRDLPLKIHTSVGPARVSPANVRLDWSHPCNLGWLLAMAREATADPTLYICIVPGALLDGEDRWCVGLPGRRGLIQAETEPEALLRAILATRGER